MTPPAIVVLLWGQLAITAGLAAWSTYPAGDSDEALGRLARHDVHVLKDGLTAYLAPRPVGTAPESSSHAYCRHGRPQLGLEPEERRGRSPLGWAVFVDRRRESLL